MSAISSCPECLKKQQQIDRLVEENQLLKKKLRYQERQAKEGFFGSSTSSAKIPLKGNTARPEEERKPKGARQGHPGAGRKVLTESAADQVIPLSAHLGDRCPDCGGLLEDKGMEERTVMESAPLKAQRILYRLPKRYCPKCRKIFKGRVPGVLPRSLYGNQLVATATVMHYLHGIPLSRVGEQIGMGPGSLVEIFHRVAGLLEGVPARLVEEYRQSLVRHADETGWRRQGQNGYVWLFATEKISIFQFRQTRSSEVPQAVFGKDPLAGVLVVDRYAGYNKTPCTLQYCYAHLCREVEDLSKEFTESPEVQTFCAMLIPLLALAMGLRRQPLSETKFYTSARKVKSQILAVIHSPAQHQGIRHIQDIFRENAHRLYHWAENRDIPAENNLAERDLRPTVIARKVSFGSQSDAGAHTRGILMSVLYSLKKRGIDAASHLKSTLDELAKDVCQDPFSLLFSRDPPTTQRRTKSISDKNTVLSPRG